MNRFRKSSQRDGFVLVMVLVLITVVALSVGGFARKSLELAQEVASAQESLERRWGTISCQRVFLAQAEDLLERAVPKVDAKDVSWPLPWAVEGEFTLGNLKYTVMLSDEDAKVNLNALARRGPNQKNQLAAIVRRSTGSSGLVTILRVPAANERSRPEALFRSWGQVFDLTGFSTPAEIAERLCPATVGITCWGGGRLNLRRAPDDSIRSVCEGEVSGEALRKLLAARREEGIENLDTLLGGLDFKAKDLMALRRLTTDVSNCHALWLTAHGTRRDWVTLSIDKPGQGSTSTRETFTW